MGSTQPVANGGERTAFFYGTLMAPSVLYRVVYGTSSPTKEERDALTIAPAILPDFCRHRVRYCDYPGIIPEKGKSVRGVYVTGITAQGVFRLDMFEGSQYDREIVQVELQEVDAEGVKSMVSAETYVYTAGNHELEKVEWDFEEFKRDRLHRWADTSKEYAEVDEAVQGQHDPTGGRGVKTDMDEKLAKN